jgi:hypothetical protein
VKYKLVTSCRECQGRVYGEDQNTKPAYGDNLCELPPSPMHFRSFVPVIILQNFIAYPISVKAPFELRTRKMFTWTEEVEGEAIEAS